MGKMRLEGYGGDKRQKRAILTKGPFATTND